MKDVNWWTFVKWWSLCVKKWRKKNICGKKLTRKKNVEKKIDKQISFNIICVWRVYVRLQKADYTLLDGLFLQKNNINKNWKTLKDERLVEAHSAVLLRDLFGRPMTNESCHSFSRACLLKLLSLFSGLLVSVYIYSNLMRVIR